MDKLLEKNYSFYAKQLTTGKIKFVFFGASQKQKLNRRDFVQIFLLLLKALLKAQIAKKNHNLARI